MYIKQLKRSVRPLTNRMQLNKGLMILAAGLTLSGAASMILCTVSVFYPVPFLLNKVLTIYGVCMGAALTLSVFMRPGTSKTFRTADSLGLKERLVTALELEGDTSPLALAQRADALAKASSADFSSLYPVKLPLKLIAAAAAFAIIIPLVSLIPSPAKEEALRAEELKYEIAEQVENIKKEQEELTKKPGLSEEALKEINNKIDEMLKELQESKSPDDALKALSKTKNELDKLKEPDNSEDLNKLAQQLAENTQTKDLSEALKSGNMDDIKQKLEELQRNTESMESSKKEQLAKDLQKASEELKNNQQLSNSLSNLSEALASGSQTNTNQAIGSLEQSISGLSSGSQLSAEEAQKALNDMLASISNAKNELSDLQQSGSLTASGDNPSPAGSSSPNGQNSSPGNQPGNQPGNSSGQGQGSSQSGMGSDGAGDGSSNNDLGYSGEETGGGSKKPGETNIKDYEKIYVPERLGGDSDPSQVNGQKGNAGQSYWTDSNAPVEKGDILPYGSVLGDYKSEAMRGLQDSTIPAGMKDLVRDYFTSLE